MMLTRPPPLQLQLGDSYPPALPRNREQVRSFIAQVYQANWRNVVIGVAAINALRFFFSASNAFQDVGVDNLYNAPKLAQISTALGAMYVTTAVIQIFGVFSTSMQQLKLIQVYAYLAFISALLVTVAGFVASVSYFLLADDLVHQCVSLTTAGKLDSKSIFRGEPWPRKALSASAAQDQCLKAWSTESMSQVLSVFIFSLLPSIAFFLLAYVYYRQATDPNHPANLCLANPSSAIHTEAYQNVRYSPIYNRSSLPQHSDDITNAGVRPRTPKRGKAKPTVAHLQFSPVMQTASPYGMTPGPPSFGPLRDYRPGDKFFSIGEDD